MRALVVAVVVVVAASLAADVDAAAHELRLSFPSVFELPRLIFEETKRRRQKFPMEKFPHKAVVSKSLMENYDGPRNKFGQPMERLSARALGELPEPDRELAEPKHESAEPRHEFAEPKQDSPEPNSGIVDAREALRQMKEAMLPLEKKVKVLGKKLANIEEENYAKDSGIKKRKKGEWKLKTRDRMLKSHQKGMENYKVGTAEVGDLDNDDEKAHQVKKVMLAVSGTDPETEKAGNFFRSVSKAESFSKVWSSKDKNAGISTGSAPSGPSRQKDEGVAAFGNRRDDDAMVAEIAEAEAGVVEIAEDQLIKEADDVGAEPWGTIPKIEDPNHVKRVRRWRRPTSFRLQ